MYLIFIFFLFNLNMMNLMIYFIINLSLNNCQNIFISYSNSDNSIKENSFYSEFHQSHNQLFKDKKNISTEFKDSNNIIIKDIQYNAIFNKIHPYKDYKEKIIIYSPNPITINIDGVIYINNDSNSFTFRKNIYFYSINEIEFQTNNITLEFNFKYKKIKRFYDLELEKNINYSLYFPILNLLDNEVIPNIIKQIEIEIKHDLTERYKKIFKNETIVFTLASFFGEFYMTLQIEKDGFCQSINNSERIFCPMTGMILSEFRESKKNEKGKIEFIEDINSLSSQIEFKENENGIYINYLVFEEIFHIIHQTYYSFTLTNSNKPSYFPNMNIDYLKQFFHNIGSYYLLSEEFDINFLFQHYEKENQNNGKVIWSFTINIKGNMIFLGFITINFSYKLFFETQRISILIDTFNIDKLYIKESIFRIKDKNYFINKIKKDWIEKGKYLPLFQKGINFYKYILYYIIDKKGKNGFYIKGKKDKYFQLDIN